MENVSAEMEHFFEACEILVHEMSPRDFSVKECTLIEHYSPVTTDYKERDKRLHGQYERLPYLA